MPEPDSLSQKKSPTNADRLPDSQLGTEVGRLKEIHSKTHQTETEREGETESHRQNRLKRRYKDRQTQIVDRRKYSERGRTDRNRWIAIVHRWKYSERVRGKTETDV